jgi:hypothetical protein
MAQNYGTNTVNLMDTPLSLKSVFAPYVGDNGYKFASAGTIQVVSTADGTLSDYTETSTTPITVGLVGNSLATLTLAYNKALFQRIQQTLIQDTPVANFAAQWAKQQINDVFVPTHDVYSLNKVILGRATDNDVLVTLSSGSLPATGLSLAFGQAFINIHAKGADVASTIAWITDSFANALADQITFTGSDAGYNDAKNSAFLGKYKGVACVAAPDSYFTKLGATSQLQPWVVMADKRAIVNVTPKMAPTDYKVLTEISGFSGVEIQMRDRGDTFVLGNKTTAISVIRTTGTIS